MWLADVLVCCEAGAYDDVCRPLEYTYKRANAIRPYAIDISKFNIIKNIPVNNHLSKI